MEPVAELKLQFLVGVCQFTLTTSFAQPSTSFPARFLAASASFVRWLIRPSISEAIANAMANIFDLNRPIQLPIPLDGIDEYPSVTYR